MLRAAASTRLLSDPSNRVHRLLSHPLKQGIHRAFNTLVGHANTCAGCLRLLGRRVFKRSMWLAFRPQVGGWAFHLRSCADGHLGLAACRDQDAPWSFLRTRLFRWWNAHDVRPTATTMSLTKKGTHLDQGARGSSVV